MIETSTPLAADLPPEWNTSDLLLRRLDEDSEGLLFVRKDGQGGYENITRAQFHRSVVAVAKGLVALGVKPGDSVAVMSATRVEWTVVDFAIFFAGAVTVPIYETSSAHQAAWILEDSNVSIAIADTPSTRSVLEHAAASRSTVDSHEEDSLRVFTIDEGGIEELSALGAEISDEDLEAARSSRTLDDVATVVYTSGTTGRPKGCEITHRNLAVIAVNCSEYLPEFLKRPGAKSIMFLPLAHVLARCVQLVCVDRGIPLLHAAGASELVADLSAFQPTFLLAVPRVFEKIYAQAEAKAGQGAAGRVFAAAASTAIAYSQAEKPSLTLRAKRALFDKIIYSKVREVFGGAVEYTVSGASPLAPRLAHFFRSAGIPVLEGYGLTESTAPLTVNQPGHTKIGTVGRPLPGTSLHIADDGEILAQGVGVFRAYRNNAEATESAFSDGWFRTGDLGTLDDEGFLTVTGRKKELIVTAGGKNVAPAPLEERIRESALVDQAVLLGEGRPFVGALIALDPEGVRRWTRETLGTELSPDEAVDSDEVKAQIQKSVDYANELVSRAEQIRAFVLTAESFDEDSGRLTPSLKLKRNVVLQDFEPLINRLYGS